MASSAFAAILAYRIHLRTWLPIGREMWQESFACLQKRYRSSVFAPVSCQSDSLLPD
jgi:hypothetical protein